MKNSASVKVGGSTADATHVPPSQTTTMASSPAVTPIKTHPPTNNTANPIDKGGMTTTGTIPPPSSSLSSQRMVSDTPATTTPLPAAAEDSTADLTPPPIHKATNSDMGDTVSSTTETATSILLGVQALERQQQRKQYELEALGVLALERQQAEVEARRRRSNSLSKSLTAPNSLLLTIITTPLRHKQMFHPLLLEIPRRRRDVDRNLSSSPHRSLHR